MNNDNTIKLINENGKVKEYSRIPDLWHLAMQLSDDKPTQDAILEVWHMAHDLKAVIEQQGRAKIIS